MTLTINYEKSQQIKNFGNKIFLIPTYNMSVQRFTLGDRLILMSLHHHFLRILGVNQMPLGINDENFMLHNHNLNLIIWGGKRRTPISGRRSMRSWRSWRSLRIGNAHLNGC